MNKACRAYTSVITAWDQANGEIPNVKEVTHADKLEKGLSSNKCRQVKNNIRTANIMQMADSKFVRNARLPSGICWKIQASVR